MKEIDPILPFLDEQIVHRFPAIELLVRHTKRIQRLRKTREDMTQDSQPFSLLCLISDMAFRTSRNKLRDPIAESLCRDIMHHSLLTDGEFNLLVADADHDLFLLRE